MRIRSIVKFPTRQILVCLVTLAALAVLSPAAFGCSCDYLPKDSTAFRKARAVFIGEVVRKSLSKQPANWDDDTAPPAVDVVTFKVERRWKGAKSAEVDAWIDVRFSHCSSLSFREGEKYLVYADSYKGSLVVYWCDKSALTASLSSEEAQKRVRQLK